MTTSFAYFIRGSFAQAVRANAGGALLALFSAMQIPWCWWSAVRGRLAGVSRPAECLLWIMAVVGATTAVQWIVRICVG
jgi:hypothetical protein